MRVRRLERSIAHISLDAHRDFQDVYVEEMVFPEEAEP
jgi:uncharacterized 2Fe-2S/4Fe-4S cluster protein (DUF4445 family)